MSSARGSWTEVLGVFTRLGLTSFGGPVAHLGYFRAEFVQRRRWFDDAEYADLVALCQFLPGPASSQVGFAVGLRRAGPAGALAAWAGFTLPSAVLLVAFAYGADLLSGPVGAGVLAGLGIVAVAIVAQAVWGMARTLTPDAARAGIAVGALVLVTLAGSSLAQLAAIALGAVAGLVLCRPPRADPEASDPQAPDPQAPDPQAAGPQAADPQAPAAPAGPLPFPVSRAWGLACLIAVPVLLVAIPALAAATGSGAVSLFDAFVRTGSLVFGGGHVVLPLLQTAVVGPGWVTDAQFLAGYGAAQAVPGPLFTFAAYLGTLSTVGPGGAAGAAIALVGVFLPGMLLLVGVLPFWNAFRRQVWAQAVMRGANAAVVGILAAALYAPVFTTAVTGPGPFCLAAVCFVLLVAFRLPPWVVVIVGAAGGVLLAFS